MHIQHLYARGDAKGIQHQQDADGSDEHQC